MLEFKLVDVAEIPYFYQERSCGMAPEEVNAAMSGAFQEVWDFLLESGVATTGKALTVYQSIDPERMTFRSGFSVESEAEASAEDPTRYATTPAGQILHFRHTGPYSKLRDSYGQMMAHVEKEGIRIGAPTWEVYLNDPTKTPEDELLTDVFVSLA
ncbi:GyrI-like domain-containing protein [Roseibium aggregatum]|uniref:GyrI-like domain-containing protein n=1 Tax=Roseibium aggregatum TaxID=187304 RepID=A0A926NWX8_9HYPH|nr:GyrI-like domain-containing protein [Roseibium aggregatum]MBD1545298.1 GyrI-like domain-containing protein [Roseibium aggregatum]